jgi:putative membrane protein
MSEQRASPTATRIRRNAMKSLESFRITPVAAALFLGGALLSMSACKGHDADDATPADTAAAPAADTTTPPADTAAANDGMAGDTGAMAGADTTATTDTSATDMSGDATAMGPVTDTQFYQQALAGGQKEIDASKLEKAQGSSADAKKVADKLITDHTAMGKKVMAAAGSGVTAPAPDTSTPADLQGKTGKDFDKAWVDMMVSDHEKTIAMFENAAKNASTDAAKKLASDALPTLREHLKAVQDLQAKMGSM